jgi:hypothetical protein
MVAYNLDKQYNNQTYSEEAINYKEFESCTFLQIVIFSCNFIAVIFIDCHFHFNFNSAKLIM